jgi:hypothetical protein
MLLCTSFANRLEEIFVEISRLELMIERNFREAIGKICATETAVFARWAMTLTQAELLIRPAYINLRCLLSHPPAQTIAVGKSDLWQETCTACDQAGFHKERRKVCDVMTKPCPVCKQQLTKKAPTETVQCACGKHVWQGS